MAAELRNAIAELEYQATRHGCGDCLVGTCWGHTKRRRLIQQLSGLDAMPTRDFFLRMVLAHDGYQSEKYVSKEDASWIVDRVFHTIEKGVPPNA